MLPNSAELLSLEKSLASESYIFVESIVIRYPLIHYFWVVPVGDRFWVECFYESVF